MNAQSLFILFAAAIGGVAGCLAWLVLNRIAGLPFAAFFWRPSGQAIVVGAFHDAGAIHAFVVCCLP